MRTSLGVLVFIALLAACVHLKPGGSCREAEATCSTPGMALSCKGGVVVEFPCTGPHGCSVATDRAVTCDQSEGAVPGTPCFEVYEGLGHCAPDKQSRTQCVGGLWVSKPCPADSACVDGESGVACVANGTG